MIDGRRGATRSRRADYARTGLACPGPLRQDATAARRRRRRQTATDSDTRRQASRGRATGSAVYPEADAAAARLPASSDAASGAASGAASNSAANSAADSAADSALPLLATACLWLPLLLAPAPRTPGRPNPQGRTQKPDPRRLNPDPSTPPRSGRPRRSMAPAHRQCTIRIRASINRSMGHSCGFRLAGHPPAYYDLQNWVYSPTLCPPRPRLPAAPLQSPSPTKAFAHPPP
jgi:hypothetical protein